ncbi:unnamed protein product, partial [Clonostachys rosea]
MFLFINHPHYAENSGSSAIRPRSHFLSPYYLFLGFLSAALFPYPIPSQATASVDMDSPSSPPPGSYPASLPPGWTAQWNEQYKAWYFFNSQTGVSQWDHPGSAKQASGDSQMEDDEALAARLQAEEDSRATPQLNMKTHPYRGNTAMEDSDAALAARLQAEEDALAAQQRSPQPQHPYSPNHFPQNPAFSPPPQQQQQQPYGGDYMGYQQQPQSYPQQPYQQQPYQQQQQGFGPQGYPQYQGYPNQQQAAYPNQQYTQPQPQTTGSQSGGFLGKLTDKAKVRLSAAGVNLPASSGSGSGGGIVGLGNSALAGFKDKLKTKNKPAQPQNNNANSNTGGYPMYGAYVYDNGGGHHGGHHGGHQGGHNGGHSGGHHGGDGGGGSGGDGGGGGVSGG